MEEVLCGAQRFKPPPFKVEPADCHTADGGKGWEIQIFNNEDVRLLEELEGAVMTFSVLSVNLVSVVKAPKKKRRGIPRRIGSPGWWQAWRGRRHVWSH
jgi:hypothetical protein